MPQGRTIKFGCNFGFLNSNSAHYKIIIQNSELNLMKYLKYVGVLLLFASAVGIYYLKFYEDPRYALIKTTDANASQPTKALFDNLKNISKEKILFGHQDGLAYGVGWNDWHKKRSDVKDVCGKYPAVFGWDMSKLGLTSYNIDSVDFQQMKDWMKEVYKMGGINTISWHMDNLANGGSSWDVQDSLRVVASILPNGKNHEAYKKKLDHFVDFVNDLEVGFIFKEKVPIIFRPFHEHTGSWFWWGAKFCTPDEYKSLWKFTVKYLRDEKGLDHILYAYSPDIFKDEAHYLERYPGDEWVDILGLDDYHDVGLSGHIEHLTERLRTVVKLAEEKDKVAALTETGFESIPQATWWTDKLLNGIKKDTMARKIAWVLVWRNDRPDHHYAPYPQHGSAANFIKFSEDPIMLFEDKLPELYKLTKK